jgi:hypothetical protein
VRLRWAGWGWKRLAPAGEASLGGLAALAQPGVVGLAHHAFDARRDAGPLAPLPPLVDRHLLELLVLQPQHHDEDQQHHLDNEKRDQPHVQRRRQRDLPEQHSQTHVDRLITDSTRSRETR